MPALTPPGAHRADRAPDAVAARAVRGRHQGPRAGGAAGPAAHGLPARSRPHRARQGVPPPEAQDPGLPGARGRPLPRAAHPHPRRLPDRAHRRPRARGSTRTSPRPSRSGTTWGTRRSATSASRRSTPFLGRPFRHSEQSLRIVELLENDGEGLNLTWEVRDGIVHHPWSMPPPSTLEAQVVRFADRIAYLNHDLDDAVRAGVLEPGELPAGPLAVLGRTHSERINTLVTDLVTPQRGPGGGPPVARGLRGARRRCATSCSSRSTCARTPARSTRRP